MHTRRPALWKVATAALILSPALAAGCESDAQTGSLIGAGIGALAGQAIGGDTEGTLIGAAVGGVAGYAVGNESDKAKAKQASRDRRYDPRSAQPSARRDWAQQPQPRTNNPLAGTSWRIVSLVWDNAPVYEDIVVRFGADGSLAASLTGRDGVMERSVMRYRVVADALVVERAGRIINAGFSVAGDELIVVAQEGRAVLRKVY